LRSHRRYALVLFALTLNSLGPRFCTAQVPANSISKDTQDARPEPAIPAIIKAFETFEVVAMPAAHGEKDIATFRMITSQFCVSGYARQSDIIRAFGVTSISVKRSVKLYREKGTKGFYLPRMTRGAAVLTASVVARSEELLAAGGGEAEVAETLGLKLNTLQKAIRAGRVRRPAKKKSPPQRR